MKDLFDESLFVDQLSSKPDADESNLSPNSGEHYLPSDSSESSDSDDGKFARSLPMAPTLNLLTKVPPGSFGEETLARPSDHEATAIDEHRGKHCWHTPCHHPPITLPNPSDPVRYPPSSSFSIPNLSLSMHHYPRRRLMVATTTTTSRDLPGNPVSAEQRGSVAGLPPKQIIIFENFKDRFPQPHGPRTVTHNDNNFNNNFDNTTTSISQTRKNHTNVMTIVDPRSNARRTRLLRAIVAPVEDILSRTQAIWRATILCQAVRKLYGLPVAQRRQMCPRLRHQPRVCVLLLQGHCMDHRREHSPAVSQALNNTLCSDVQVTCAFVSPPVSQLRLIGECHREIQHATLILSGRFARWRQITYSARSVIIDEDDSKEIIIMFEAPFAYGGQAHVTLNWGKMLQKYEQPFAERDFNNVRLDQLQPSSLDGQFAISDQGRDLPKTIPVRIADINRDSTAGSCLTEMFPLLHSVSYKYYAGKLSSYEVRYHQAGDDLTDSLRHTPYEQGDSRRVSSYLIPEKILSGSLPETSMLETYHKKWYIDIVAASKTGNGYAYLDFQNTADAERVLEMIDYQSNPLVKSKLLCMKWMIHGKSLTTDEQTSNAATIRMTFYSPSDSMLSK